MKWTACNIHKFDVRPTPASVIVRSLSTLQDINTLLVSELKMRRLFSTEGDSRAPENELSLSSQYHWLFPPEVARSFLSTSVQPSNFPRSPSIIDTNLHGLSGKTGQRMDWWLFCLWSARLFSLGFCERDSLSSELKCSIYHKVYEVLPTATAYWKQFLVDLNFLNASMLHWNATKLYHKKFRIAWRNVVLDLVILRFSSNCPPMSGLISSCSHSSCVFV